MQSSAHPGSGRAPLAVFVSGSGRTLENLLSRCADGSVHGEVVLVVASRECRGAEIGRGAGVRALVHEERWNADELREVLDECGCADGWVVLAGYLQLLPIPGAYAGRVVNIHPALLPAHGGGGMFGDRVHRAVLDAGEKEAGCTVHLCDGVYDRGEVLAQARCGVEAGDSVRTLADRVFGLETELYPRVIEELIRGEHEGAVSRARTRRVGGTA